jgi:hypothetical protein
MEGRPSLETSSWSNRGCGRMSLRLQAFFVQRAEDPGETPSLGGHA